MYSLFFRFCSTCIPFFIKYNIIDIGVESMSQSFEEWVSNKKSYNRKSTVHKEEIELFINNLWVLFFCGVEDESHFESKLKVIAEEFSTLLDKIDCSPAFKTEQTFHLFLEQLPKIDSLLSMDIDAFFDGDPAANSKEEIILCYPGLYAIFVYRIAHELAELEIPTLPRLLSEYAHGKTGIDIHPKAKIGHHFFIDHGTGIVIGETTEIGNYVKLYHGVTLGALSLKKGHQLKGTKRHPTILDHVTIYSNASIFGGDTIVGPNVRIGSCAFITESIKENRENI